MLVKYQPGLVWDACIHVFIYHLLLIYRILYFNLVLFISHKAVTSPSSYQTTAMPCLSVIVWYMVRMQLSGYLRKNVLIQLFCCIGTYEPLQPICRWFFFSFLLYFIFIFFPSHQHDSIVVCYSTRVQSGISNSISKRSSSLIL